MIYQCGEDRRRAAVARHPTANGIDFLEVVDTGAATPADRQRVLLVRLVKPLGAVPVTPADVAISGGDRIRDIAVVEVRTDPASTDIEVHLDRWGDFSRYTLRLVDLPGFDVPLSSVEFSFKTECPTDADCGPGCGCADEPGDAPEIDYLTRDYQGLRRLMLDRISTLAPDWTERHAADFGVSLVELLAYVGDQLSYAQDAIATEAYLATARRRVSVRRHARLVDYRVDEGAAARVLVRVRVAPGEGPVTLPATPSLVDSAPVPGQVPAPVVRFLTRDPSRPDPAPVVDPASPDFAAALDAGVAVFELAEPTARTLREAHNEMSLYTWGGQRCCLPTGATEATLVGDLGTLKPGDIVVFAEVKGAQTGLPPDADRTHRHPVRLTGVTVTDDPLAAYFDEAPEGSPPPPLPVTTITWDPVDGLPFPLCISTEVDEEPVTGVSVAYGNIVLADHGLTVPAAQRLPEVPAATLSYAGCGGGPVPPRYRPRLPEAPLTWQSLPYDPARPVADLRAMPAVVHPALVVTEPALAQLWTVQPDLLDSDAGATDLVVEVDDEVRAGLRFGDDQCGRRPATGTVLYAHYRVGNGPAGNIAADAIRQVVTTVTGIGSATNPVPGWGGRAPETLDEVRERAPIAFRSQERAVTADDYAAAAQRHPQVARAVAAIEWTGSWRTVFVAVDRVGGRPVDAAFAGEVAAFLERFRLAGHDVAVEPPVFVPLEIELFVCVAPDRFREDVAAALRALFARAFDPDRLTFGQAVLLSPIYAAAQAVPGVRSVDITTFQRYGQPGTSALDSGALPLGRTEIARLDNDPDFPDRGVLRMTFGGGL
jgi:hypothetical protein